MSDKQSQNAVVFSFRLEELKEIRDRREREKAEKFLREKFEEWSLDSSRPMEFKHSDLKQIITVTPDDKEPQAGAELLVKWAQRMGAVLKCLGLSTSQIRNIFGAVRQIEMMWTPSADQDSDKQALAISKPSANPDSDKQAQAIRKLILLKPKLAYQAERHEPVKPLEAVLRQAIDQVQGKRENFVRFVEFFEAILAYHTAFGGGQ